MNVREKLQRSLFVMSLIALPMVGCIEGVDGTAKEEDKIKAVDAVKFIEEGNENPKAVSSFDQPSYRIHKTSRLLMRYEDVNEIEDDIRGGSRDLVLRIELVYSQDKAQALQQLELCPIVGDWMMGATWEKGHPYPGGKWLKPGGEFDEALCVKPFEDSTNPACQATNFVCFDLSEWFQRYVVEADENRGFAIKTSSGSGFVIYGDGSSRGPRLLW